MKITVIYDDNQSLTASEVIESNKNIFGNNCEVVISPNNESPEANIYFGIQNLITERQIKLFFDDGAYIYEEKIKDLRAEILEKVSEILNKVIIDNEERIT